jgi:hypothetical protein
MVEDNSREKEKERERERERERSRSPKRRKEKDPLDGSGEAGSPYTAASRININKIYKYKYPNRVYQLSIFFTLILLSFIVPMPLYSVLLCPVPVPNPTTPPTMHDVE